jgi:hypothetical protein
MDTSNHLEKGASEYRNDAGVCQCRLAADQSSRGVTQWRTLIVPILEVMVDGVGWLAYPERR